MPFHVLLIRVGLFVMWSCSAQAAQQAPAPDRGAEPKASGVQRIPAAAVSVSGRTAPLPNDGLDTGYPGVSLGFWVDATDLTVTVNNVSGSSYWDVQVDGQWREQPLAASEPGEHLLSLLRDAELGVHHVRMVRRNELWTGRSHVLHFDFVGTQWGTWPQQHPHKLLVLGDSITCGQGNARTAVGLRAGKSPLLGRPGDVWLVVG